ncbi:nuclease-related domain-containing protein [Bacillus coreaensis]
MLLKSRKESENLLLYRSLFLRMSLSEKDVSHYQRLEKGYAGELLFDQYISTLTNEFLLLNDVLLDSGNNLFQMDSLAIFQESVLLFEVKNFEGDFFVRGDRWYTSSDKEIKNPLEQLQRSESLLRRFLQEHGCMLPIEPILVFVNPEFTLYQAPMKTPIIYPTQIQRLLRTLANKPTKMTHLHEKMANKLLTHHLTTSPIKRKPEYSYEMLQKGIYCSHCYTFFKDTTETRLVCTCGTIESIDDAIVRSVHEFMLLFPDQL